MADRELSFAYLNCQYIFLYVPVHKSTIKCFLRKPETGVRRRHPYGDGATQYNDANMLRDIYRVSG
jgi:hypothetical protein